jgi:hypothetical protein
LRATGTAPALKARAFRDEVLAYLMTVAINETQS